MSGQASNGSSSTYCQVNGMLNCMAKSIICTMMYLQAGILNYACTSMLLIFLLIQFTSTLRVFSEENSAPACCLLYCILYCLWFVYRMTDYCIPTVWKKIQNSYFALSTYRYEVTS